MESPKRAACKNFIGVQEFKNGELDVKNLQDVFPSGVQCLRIVIGTKQKSWVAITEVAVFTEEEVEQQQLQDVAPDATTTTTTSPPSLNNHNKTLRIQ